MKINRLMYNNEPIGYRVFNKTTTEVYDIGTSALDAVLVVEMDKRFEEEEELTLYNGVATTELEQKTGLIIEDKSNCYKAFKEIYTLCEQPTLSGNILYTVNGAILADISASLQPCKEGYTLRSLYFEAVYANKENFDKLVQHNVLEVSEEPTSYPYSHICTLEGEHISQLLESYDLCANSQFIVFKEIDHQNKVIDEEDKTKPLYTKSGEQTGLTVGDFIASVEEKILYTYDSTKTVEWYTVEEVVNHNALVDLNKA